MSDLERVQQLLLARLAGEPDDGPPLQELLEQSLGDDPAMAPVLAALRRRTAAEAAEAANQAGAEAAQEAAREAPAGAGADPMVVDVLERLYAEVEELRLRNRTVAAALGACPRCWGEAPDCPTCRGRGRPGGRAPDAVLYHELVEPAVRRRARQEQALAGAAEPRQ